MTRLKAHEHAVLDLYLGSFAARHDAYVQDSRWHRNEELTPEVAYAAFGAQPYSVSGYMARWVEVGNHEKPLEPERHCLTHVGAVDFDMQDGMEHARKMRANLAADWGIPSMVVGSRRGAHLWVTSHYKGGMLPANIMRGALAAMVEQMQLDPAKAEVFPKKSESDWGVGALRMPLMRHPKTGVRYSAYDPADREVNRLSDVVGVMADLMNETTLDALYALSKTRAVSTPYPVPQGPYRRPSTAAGDAPTISQLLGQHYGVQANPGHSVRCPFHSDKKASLQVAQDDERCWCKSPTCEMYNDGRGYGSLELARYLERSSPIAPSPT